MVELPGIEPAALPGHMLPELRFRYASVRFSPLVACGLGSRVLTGSRAFTYHVNLLQTPAGSSGGNSERVTRASARCGHIRYHPVMPADTPGRRLKVLVNGLHQLGARCETLGGELSTPAPPHFEAAFDESRAAL